MSVKRMIIILKASINYIILIALFHVHWAPANENILRHAIVN